MKLVINWKTTSAGLVALLAGLSALFGDLSMSFASGLFDMNKLFTDVGMISAGCVGLFSKDFNVTGK